MSFAQFSKTAIYNLFHKPVTEKYPFVLKEYYERTRGHIENDMTKCVLCGLCMMRCPSHAITVTKNTYTWQINPFSCVQCNYCVEGCPKQCLSMKNTYTQPDTKKTPVVLRYSEERIAEEEAKRKAMIEKAMAAKKAAEAKKAAAAADAGKQMAAGSGAESAGGFTEKSPALQQKSPEVS